MSSYIDLSKNNNFSSFLEENKIEKILSKKAKETEALNIEKSLKLQDNAKVVVTTEEILNLYKNISKN